MPIEKGAEFFIEVDRKENAKYGWDVVFKEDYSGILVKSVSEGGMIESWNEEHADSPLEPGDLIVDVNGARGKDMKIHLGLQAANETGPVKFLIKKGCADDVPRPKSLRSKLLKPFESFKLSSWGPLLVLSVSSRLSAMDDNETRLAVIAFFVCVAVRLIISCCEYFKIKAFRADGVVDVPPEVWLGQEVKPATQVNAQAYDMGLWKEHTKELVIGTIVVSVIFYIYGNIVPMAMNVVSMLLKGFESPLIRVHILGRNLARPYGAKPLAGKGLQALQKEKKLD